MTVLAIDPGSTESAWVRYVDGRFVGFGKQSNNSVMWNLVETLTTHDRLVIEKIASYGMPVGEEVFETVYWSGRLHQACVGIVHRITRGEVKMHLCQTMRAKDANVRQAIIDRFGGKQAIKKGGALHGVSGDVWAALGVYLTWEAQQHALANRATL